MKNIKLEKSQEILNLLYLIIDINRVGSDEISVIEDCIEIIEKNNTPYVSIENLNTVSNHLTDLYSWSDRLGSDEVGIIKDILQLVKTY